jgi:hypothetical protein
MPEIAGLSVRGPVRTCRHELSEWDEDHQVWKPSYGPTIVTFRPDFQVIDGESHNADGSVARWANAYDAEGRVVEEQWWQDDGPRSSVLHAHDPAGRRTRSVHVASDGTRRDAEICSYDSNGRKTRVCFLPDPEPHTIVGYGIELSGVAHGVPGAATMTLTYDHRGLTAEGIFRDASHTVVRRIVHSRDEDGRLVSAAVYLGGEMPFRDLPPEAANISAEERVKLESLLAQVFADRTFASVEYAYDGKSRMLKRIIRMGNLSEDRTTFRYDDRDDPIEEIQEHRSRGANLDDHGVVQATDERWHTSETRFEYQYDEHANWTERIVWCRHDAQSEFRRSNMIQRVITYY